MYKNIIFDFDGVILDSTRIKTEAYTKLFEGYTSHAVDTLIAYHTANGGISRYEKIRYFFERILQRPVDVSLVSELAERYSELTKAELSQKKYLIRSTVDFIRRYVGRYNFHIASGADEGDLKYICDQLGISGFFLSINGSPRKKDVIVREIIDKNAYEKSDTCLIGDSVNDWEAARINGLNFFGFRYHGPNNGVEVLTDYTSFDEG